MPRAWHILSAKDFVWWGPHLRGLALHSRKVTLRELPSVRHSKCSLTVTLRLRKTTLQASWVVLLIVGKQVQQEEPRPTFYFLNC